MLADMGSKALPEFPFTSFRDTMNGYALVRARFPDKVMSPYIYEIEDERIKDLCKATDKYEAAIIMQPEANPRNHWPHQPRNQLKSVQAMIMQFTYHEADDENHDTECDTEEEEDEVNSDDGMDENPEGHVNDGEVIIPLPAPLALHHPIPIGPTPPLEEDLELEFNDNPFEFNHKWTLYRAFPEYKEPVFELDNLPDPRLYNIDVAQLHAFARLSSFDASYENYLVHVEKDYFAKIVSENLCVNTDLLVDEHLHNLMQGYFKKSNPIMFFPPVLSANEKQRKKQIHRALNTYVITLDTHIKSKTMYDSLDNIHCGIGTGEPSPKLSWLRWIRWRRYFIHMKLSVINHLRPELGPLPRGVPHLREIDKERMSLQLFWVSQEYCTI